MGRSSSQSAEARECKNAQIGTITNVNGMLLSYASPDMRAENVFFAKIRNARNLQMLPNWLIESVQTHCEKNLCRTTIASVWKES